MKPQFQENLDLTLTPLGEKSINSSIIEKFGENRLKDAIAFMGYEGSYLVPDRKALVI